MADWPSGLPVECGFPVDRNAGVAGNGVVHGIISLILVLPGSACSSEKITKMGGTAVLASVRTTHVDELRTVGSFVTSSFAYLPKVNCDYTPTIVAP